METSRETSRATRSQKAHIALRAKQGRSKMKTETHRQQEEQSRKRAATSSNSNSREQGTTKEEPIRGTESIPR